MPLKLGYNTNGFEHHALDDAIEIIAEIGYTSIAITLDTDKLDPFGEDIEDEIRHIRGRLEHWGLSCVFETGSRFLLDPLQKHEPTLVSEDPEGRARRLEFLTRAVDVAEELGSNVVSFWSGRKPPTMPESVANGYLLDGCRALSDHAAARGVNLAFEPEPGMFIETMAQFDRLRQELNSPVFGLTLDVGHIHCMTDGDPAERIRKYHDILFNVHIEDMRRGVHEHLMFGDGDMQFEPIMAALKETGYTGGVHVELSRHSKDAVAAARKSFDLLSPLCV
jgi:L-ribulose-5-phosphate 3-epimerase